MAVFNNELDVIKIGQSRLCSAILVCLIKGIMIQSRNILLFLFIFPFIYRNSELVILRWGYQRVELFL